MLLLLKCQDTSWRKVNNYHFFFSDNVWLLSAVLLHLQWSMAPVLYYDASAQTFNIQNEGDHIICQCVYMPDTMSRIVPIDVPRCEQFCGELWLHASVSQPWGYGWLQHKLNNLYKQQLNAHKPCFLLQQWECCYLPPSPTPSPHRKMWKNL